MAEAAAHLCDHVFPRLPVRQWVLSVPKRLRYQLQRDKGALNVPSITFHPAQIDEAAMAQVQAQVQANVRKRLLRAFVIQSDKYSGELVLTPLALIDRIAQLVPPRRIHRHRCYGVLAPNSPLREAVTAMAQSPVPACSPGAADANTGADVGTSGTAVAPGGAGGTTPPAPPATPKPRPSAHYLWGTTCGRH